VVVHDVRTRPTVKTATPMKMTANEIITKMTKKLINVFS